MTSLTDILGENGITLISSGKRWVAKCPFHEGDRSPSFTVYPNDTYFCWGCKMWGDAVKFLIDYKHMSYTDALKYVGLDYKTQKAKTIIKVRDTHNMWPFLYTVAEAYHKRLLDTEGAYLYLRTRGLTHDTIVRYKVGYSDGAVLDLVYIEDFKLAMEAGVVNESGYELLSHRITIPNIIGEDMCDFIVGRTVVNNKIKYLGIRTPKPIYGFYQLRNEPTLYLAEGQFDWLILRQWGLPAIVMGGTHVTQANISLLKTKRIIIVPDNDDVGLKAAESLHQRLGASSYILDYSSLGVKDVGEMGPDLGASKAFKKLVKEQVPWRLNDINTSKETSSQLRTHSTIAASSV